jgi:hypothetical protein
LCFVDFKQVFESASGDIFKSMHNICEKYVKTIAEMKNNITRIKIGNTLIEAISITIRYGIDKEIV